MTRMPVRLCAISRTASGETRAQTVGGVSGGPFLGSVPAPPAGWSPYQLTKEDGGRFTIMVLIARMA